MEIIDPVPDENILTSLDILQGPPIPKLKRLEIFDADTWEEITLELVSFWKNEYPKVVRCGGGGDMGRDVIAYFPNGEWENFQCKHYASPLSLNEAIKEIGKLIYYSYIDEYRPPKKYYFVTPKGVTVQLLNHLMDSEKLREVLIERWDNQCKTKITKKLKVELSNQLLSYIKKSIDFSIFDHIPPIKIIDLHSRTNFHAYRFGSAQRKRPKPMEPPSKPTDSELTYISELLLAFSDVEKCSVASENLASFPEYEAEYNSARKNYYSAENLERFSRDWLSKGSFQELLDECHETISPVALATYINGYIRYLKVCEHATLAAYPSHPLHYYIKVRDKKGLCHHLANDRKLEWVKK